MKKTRCFNDVSDTQLIALLGYYNAHYSEINLPFSDFITKCSYDEKAGGEKAMLMYTNNNTIVHIPHAFHRLCYWEEKDFIKAIKKD